MFWPIILIVVSANIVGMVHQDRGYQTQHECEDRLVEAKEIASLQYGAIAGVALVPGCIEVPPPLFFRQHIEKVEEHDA